MGRRGVLALLVKPESYLTNKTLGVLDPIHMIFATTQGYCSQSTGFGELSSATTCSRKPKLKETTRQREIAATFTEWGRVQPQVMNSSHRQVGDQTCEENSKGGCERCNSYLGGRGWLINAALDSASSWKRCRLTGTGWSLRNKPCAKWPCQIPSHPSQCLPFLLLIHSLQV